MDEPFFEVVTPATEHALTTVAMVNSLLGREATVQSDLIESLIAATSGDCARACNLAGSSPTFGAETLAATWRAARHDRGAILLLPWRPAAVIEEVVEAGVTLAADDYALLPGGRLQRLSDDAVSCWSPGKIEVSFSAGWELPDDAPAELQMQVAEQVKARLFAATRDPMLRSENVPDVWSGAWNVAGGDSVDASGLLPPLIAALAPYRNWARV